MVWLNSNSKISVQAVKFMEFRLKPVCFIFSFKIVNKSYLSPCKQVLKYADVLIQIKRRSSYDQNVLEYTFKS